MAIAQCPSCNKSISSKHTVCPHCDVALDGLSLEEQQKLARRRRAKRQQTVINYSFISLLIFLGAFFNIYWRQPEPESLELLICKAAIGLSAIWYLINRAILIMLKKKK